MLKAKPARESDGMPLSPEGPPVSSVGFVQDDVDDDAEPEGGHGQVIAPELQGRDADQEGGGP